MDELLKRAARSALFFMSALCAAWAFAPEGRTVAAGLILGTAASLVNAFLLRRRIELIARLALDNSGRKATLGLASRLATILLAVMVSYRFPEYFALPATLAGCFYVQIAVFFTAVAQNIKGNNGKG
ncbi:ATP synthase subunit I [Paenibacillus sambharensis]|uniref:ATP synthase subunit I n=1 Tax=Paenibacillus sambharensis TaxID=1803190 RepID=A0A2W1LID8_9BACL|nr:ATP synthase subunit I [Paenibacillus sambharensis]PZD97780.1 ATP synthase subunit I [Paenibacillus sambharensis]